MLKRLLLLCIVTLVLLAGLQACDLNGGPTTSSTPTASATLGITPVASPTSATTPQPAATPTNPPMVEDITRVITAYYNAIKAQDYAKAYTYLDPSATDTTTGQTLTLSSFTQLGQSTDKEEGTVATFTIGIFPPSPQVTMTITRGNMGPYHAELDMKQEGATWKIISLNRI